LKELENYINKFLKAGGHDWPQEILKSAGIDLTDTTIYEKAFKSVDKKINLYIKLGNKIFKGDK
jgi:oligoendopeptidase F